MVNQLKADFYKLFHSLLFRIFCIITIIIFIVYCSMSNTDEGYVMGYVLEEVNGYEVVQGFASFAFADYSAPTYWELIYTAVSMTFFLWILLLVIGIMYFSKEFATGAIKLSYARGNNKVKLFLSKLLVIAVVFLITFFLFNTAAYMVASVKFNCPLTLAGLSDLWITSALMYLPLVIMVLMSMVLFLWFQSPAPVTTIMLTLMFSHIFVVMSFLESGEAPWIVKLYYAVNPMSYIWVAGDYWAYPDLAIKNIAFFIVGFLVLTGGAYFLLEHKEVK